MKFASIQALLVGSFLVASSGDASAQWRGGNRGGGGYRASSFSNYPVYGYGQGYSQGYGQAYYGNSNNWTYPQSYGNTQRWYGYSPYYGNGYSYYTTPYYTTPSYSTYGQPATVMQAQYSESSTARQALLSVWVPTADAQVWLSGTEMTTRGTDRTFAIPPLESGMNYTYTVKARWMADGRAVEQTRDVSVRAGQQSSVDFRQPASEPAPLPESRLSK